MHYRDNPKRGPFSVPIRGPNPMPIDTRPLSRSRVTSGRPAVGRGVTCCAAARLSACCSKRSIPKSSARIASSDSEMGTAGRCLIAERIDNVTFHLGGLPGWSCWTGLQSAAVRGLEKLAEQFGRRNDHASRRRGYDRAIARPDKGRTVTAPRAIRRYHSMAAPGEVHQIRWHGGGS